MGGFQKLRTANIVFDVPHDDVKQYRTYQL